MLKFGNETNKLLFLFPETFFFFILSKYLICRHGRIFLIATQAQLKVIRSSVCCFGNPICFLTLFIIQVEYCQSSRTEYHRIRVSLNQEHIQDFNFRETGLNGLYNPCIIALKVTSVLSKHNRQRCLLRAIFF